MYKTDIMFPRAEWRKLRESLKAVPKEFQQKITRETTAMVNDAVEVFEQYPGPVKTPIKWTSRKQQRWYFWTRGGFYGPGRPNSFQRYKRTGGLANDWRVVRTGNQYESTLTFSNANPYLRYVIGRDQQGFHKNTGWRPLALTQDAVRQKVRRRITRLMVLTVAEATRGKP